MKKSLAVMLALIMVLCMIPTTAFAKSASASLTVNVRGTFYNPNTDKHEYFSNLRTTTHVKVNEGENPSYPVKYYFTKQKYYGSTNSSYYGKEGYKLIVTIGGKESTDLNAWVFDRDMTNVKGDGQTFYPIYSPSGYGTYQNTLFISGGTPIQPKTGTLTINKTVTGLPNDKLPASFTFNVMQGNNVKATVTVNKNGNNGYNAGSTTLPHGTYTVVEVSATVDGYTVVTTPSNGEVTISGQPTNITFTNAYTENEPQPETPPTKPEPVNTPRVPGLTDINEAVKVKCETVPASHKEKAFGFNWFSCQVGDVTDNGADGYTCTITILPDGYVDSYNALYYSGHTLVGPENYTITLNWNAATKQWEYTENKLPVTFTVKCEVQPPLDNITIEVSKTWHDDSNTVPKPDKITVLLLADGKEVDRATIPDVNGAWSHSFGAKPANDNGKSINYTVKEEDVPDWTPYYYTAGPWNNLLAFQIHNVPTKNTREIKVTKKVSGEGADTTKEFNFKVTLLEYHDNAEVTDQPGYYPLGGTYTFGGVTFTNGVATFKLKDGDSKEITGIPTHIYSNLPLQYKVEEIAPNGYTVKVNGKEGSSINGDFAGDNKTVDIAFENVKESGTNPTPTPTPTPSPTPTPTPGGGNGGGGHSHYYPTTTPVPVIVIPPKTGDMTIWQSILHFLGIR